MGKTRQTGDITSDNNISIDITSDKIGIGTTTPSAKLSVIGDLFVSGISTLSNTLTVVGLMSCRQAQVKVSSVTNNSLYGGNSYFGGTGDNSTNANASILNTGAATFDSAVINNSLNVTDNITSGIITASSGIDAIGIQSGGVNIFTGIITALNFVGTGNTFNVDGNTVDISISGGGGGSSSLITLAFLNS